MKRLTLNKKKVLFVVLIAFLFAMIATFFCIPQKVEKVRAYDGTFYWRGDPEISATATDGRYPIRYNLIVSEGVLTDTDEVTVSLTSNSDGAYIQRSHEGTTLTDEEVEGTTQEVTFPKSVFAFSDGVASVYVDMYLNIYEKGRLTATCNSVSAVSDEHTVVSVIEIIAGNGYSGYSSTDANALAKIYDKYVGKDLTKDQGSLSLISNITPSYYTSSSPTFTAEVEIPANVAELLKNNTEVEWASYNDGLSGTYYDTSCRYYALCMTVTYDDPSSVSNASVDSLTTASRQFYYAGKTYGYYLYSDIQYAGGSSDELKQRIYSEISSWTSNLGAQLPLVTSARSSLTSISTADTTKQTLDFGSSTYSISSEKPVYFYAEVLEYAVDIRYAYISSTYTRVDRDVSVNAVYRSNVVNVSLQNIAEDLLTNNATLSDSIRGYICTWGGIDTTTEKPMEVIYKTYSLSGKYETVSQIYSISTASIYNKYSAINAMYNLSGITDISNFNIVSTRQTYDSVSGKIYNMGDVILRQALDYDYVYNATEGKGYATVVYDEFQYKDFSITIQNNDLNNLLEISYYTADIVIDNGVVTLVYNYADIEERLFNSCGWLFELAEDSFTITGDSDALIAVEVGAEELCVRIPVKYQSELFGVNVTAMAEIVPDEEYTVTYAYYTGFNVSSDGKTILPVLSEVKQSNLLLSMIKNYNNYNNFILDNKATIYAPLDEFELEYGVLYATPQDVRVSTDGTQKSCTITVTYQLHSLFLVTDSITDKWHYKQVSHTTNVYAGDEFVNAIGGVVNGYRVDKLESGANVLKVTNAYDYKDTKAVLNADTYSGDIYTLKVVFTDTWNIVINYMEQYKTTPFAVKTKYSGEIRVADYPDVYKLTSADLASILGKTSMGIINNKTTVETITVTYDGIGTYTADTTYTYMSMAKTNYDGEVEEAKIPLTCYADWCDRYGKDWSILYLNFCGNNYFEYSNDVKRDELYGFFSVAVFQDRVSDLNNVFKDMKYTGCVTIHESEEVRGSKVYKFFGGLTDSWLMGLGYVGMAFCEIVNDENAIYYSYFFFLDGTKTIAVLSESGSTEANDTDSAIKNTAQGIGSTVSDWWDGITSSFEDSTIGKIISVAFPILCVLAVGLFAIWLVKWFKKKWQ